MPDVESIRVPLPPVEEQDRIVEAVWSRLRVVGGTVDRLHRQIELLVEHRQALITAAVTGELEIPPRGGVSEPTEAILGGFVAGAPVSPAAALARRKRVVGEALQGR
ncbi:MAG: hypothetical protein V9E99_10235 [Microthrixaceae bacterium]